MAVHEVSFAVPQKFALSEDIEFNVRSGGAKLGKLLVSKGNIEWVPAGNSVKKRRLTWEQFADVMATLGKVAKIK